MSYKRPLTPQQEQSTVKRIHSDTCDEYETANTKIDRLVRCVPEDERSIFSDEDEFLASVLGFSIIKAPPQVPLDLGIANYFKALELIRANPELKEVVRNATRQQCYENVWSLRAYL